MTFLLRWTIKWLIRYHSQLLSASFPFKLDSEIIHNHNFSILFLFHLFRGDWDDRNAPERTLFASGFETADELSGAVDRSVPIHLSRLHHLWAADGTTVEPVRQRLQRPAAGLFPHGPSGTDGASASVAEREIYETGGQIIHHCSDQSRSRWRHVSYLFFGIFWNELEDDLRFFGNFQKKKTQIQTNKR